ncbi:uncharacterized protein SCHCODRAFT_02506106 [Schizophyllum commune H4-8]|uniref:Uncharacterized protein n=1 Tax=Schizophyllum commune (strain H4-8 / FGSC 9210) TaxID=578458 RepID=D8Q7E7_SCHCM|nr:uncharacterized protein SCHCODRAFT_02506106 [Schizophyllum commune H4-8]KAI5891525.1 hypothetical protein SCHCODRAFT_02506106 [Schizophyllum commune H4-8]
MATATDKFPRCYDFDAAEDRLEWLTSSRKAIAADSTLGAFLQTRVAVVDYQNGRARIASDILSSTELVLEVSGVVLDTDLPPVQRQLSENKARFVRQGLTIAGFDTDAFTDAVRDVESIRQLFERSVGGSVQKSDQIGTDLGPALCASMRYFSHRKDVEGKDIIPFSKDIDPYNHLQALTSDTFVHSRQNVVQYFEYDTDANTGTGRYTSCSPTAIKIGDLVTCKLSFVLVPMPRSGKHAWKMLNVLKAVALMDSSLTREAGTTATLEDFQVKDDKPPPLKRADLIRSFRSVLTLEDARAHEDALATGVDATAVAATTNRLRDALEDCNAERQRLRCIDLALRKRLAAIAASLSSIQRLPDDILRLVFKCIQTTFKNPYHCVDYFALTICAVSRRWRAVARSTATLWTHLSLRRARVVTVRGIPRRTTPWDHLPVLAALCASAPINIRWNWDFDVAPLVVISAQLPNIIQTLELTAQWESLAYLKSGVFLSLTRLDLTLCGGLYRFMLDHVNSLSHLAHLRVSYNDVGPFGPCKPSAPTLPNLRELSMQLIPGPPFSFISATLRGCSNISSLELRCTFANRAPGDGLSIHLKSLTSLVLADSACCLLRTIIAPGAESLSLSVVDNNDVHGSLFAAISDFVTTSACALSTLAFSRVWCTVYPDDMDRCLERMPAISNLHVHDSWDACAAGSFGEVVVQRLTRHDSLVLPNLLNADLRGPCHHYRARVASAITALWVSRTGERAKSGGVVAMKEFYSDIAGIDI